MLQWHQSVGGAFLPEAAARLLWTQQQPGTEVSLLPAPAVSEPALHAGGFLGQSPNVMSC